MGSSSMKWLQLNGVDSVDTIPLIRETLAELNGAIERAQGKGLPELDGQFS
jgi:hypothetical protein